MNDFYKKTIDLAKEHPPITTFPYRKSIRSILKALQWPEKYQYLGDNPGAVNPGWVENLNGVTTDGSNWYFTQERVLWKFPFAHPLGKDIDEDELPGGVFSRGIPAELLSEGYNHFGDFDYWRHPHDGGLLFVPLEGQKYKHETSAGEEVATYLGELNTTIALFKTETLGAPKYISSADLTHPSGSWCAINPLNGFLYTSDFNSNYLYVYKPVFITNSTNGIVGIELRYLGNFVLYDTMGKEPMTVSAIQGGVFSKNGHLYLVSDKANWFYSNPGPSGPEENDEVKNSGIFGFDMITGRRVRHLVVPYLPEYPELEELEGITIFNLNIGQIHIIMLDEDIHNDDDLYFKHFSVADMDKDKI